MIGAPLDLLRLGSFLSSWDGLRTLAWKTGCTLRSGGSYTCQTKKEGGLGIKNPRTNPYLPLKWL